MIDFEDIKNSWQAHPIGVNTDQKLLYVKKDKWERNQKRVFKSNLLISIGFFIAMLGIGWVYFTFKDQYGLPFKISIATVYILMIVFSVVSWRSYRFKKRDTDDSSQEYIQQQIKSLTWQKDVITKYMWIYTILLWLAMLLYIWEITTKATPTFRYTAFGITTLYIFGITVWGRVYKKKKQLKEINELIGDLKRLKRGFQDV